MEIFRDLYISATAEQMAKLVVEIEHRLPAGWSRDKAAEARSASRDTHRGIVYCFACRVQARPPALLVLAQKGPDTFYVSNIIPIADRKLARAEYNAILEQFYRSVFKLCAEASGIVHSFTDAAADLDHWMGPETADKLRLFSASANKGTGSSHPNDHERWNAFILSAHQEGAVLDSSILQRWLLEDEGWPPELAQELANEYRSGRELLSFADGQQVA